MAKLIYSAIASLDGFIEDQHGKFDWAMPSEQVHAYVNDLERPIGTYLYGRRMYETMNVWEDPSEFADGDPIALDYAAIWRAADKIVFSRTLSDTDIVSARTRIEREFAATDIAALKAASPTDISVGGPELAGIALHAGLVDEVRLVMVPVSVGRGKRALPDDLRLDLELLDERRFDNGTVSLHYRVQR